MYVDRIVNSVFTSNSYLLSEPISNDCWLVDIGDVQSVLNIMPDSLCVRGVFLTHTHYDHIYGINQLVNLYPDCKVYTSEHGREGLRSDKLNFSRYHGDPIVYEGTNLELLREGDEIELFPGKTMKVLETPGHDWSCLTYYTERDIFTGDAFIPGLKTVTSFPRSNKLDAAISMQKILRMSDGRDLYAGHGTFYPNFHEADW